jgi:hypothetical protein
MAELKDISRYETGSYRSPGDGVYKARDLVRFLASIPEVRTATRSFADVGCGDGSVFSAMLCEMSKSEFTLDMATGYDIGPPPPQGGPPLPPFASRKQEDFLCGTMTYDLVSLIDVVEHVVDPIGFVKAIAARCSWLLLHIPLDDRLSVVLSNQWNFRLQSVGHLSFWNPATALSMLTSAGVEPMLCGFTGGFAYPSGRVRLTQRAVLPLRWAMWRLSPGLMARTIGGVSLAVLCKGRLTRS